MRCIITPAMPSERMQRRIDGLLDQADDAVSRRAWDEVRNICDAVLRLDPENEDARELIAAAARDTGLSGFRQFQPHRNHPPPVMT